MDGKGGGTGGLMHEGKLDSALERQPFLALLGRIVLLGGLRLITTIGDDTGRYPSLFMMLCIMSNDIGA